jgi:SAM-dependent methyltransferase
MSVTELQLPTDAVDVVTCSEVLEHVLEFGAHYKCMKELHRVLRPGGIAVMATPNAEMLPNHGYRFQQLQDLVAKYFDEFCFFENAYAPFLQEERRSWEERRRSGRHGVVAPWNIVIEETCVPPEYDLTNPDHLRALREQVKTAPSGKPELGSQPIDVRHLHNTHSFLVVARKSAN